VPRPPQPITAIRILSEPAANIRLAGEAKVTAPNAADVLIKFLRDNLCVTCFVLLFMS
jgi:hypothetical protein